MLRGQIRYQFTALAPIFRTEITDCLHLSRISKSTGKQYLIACCESVGDYKGFDAVEIVSEGVGIEEFSIDILDFKDAPEGFYGGIVVTVAFLAHAL